MNTKLTKLEEFVWNNRHRSSAALATELNRSEGVIERAHSAAAKKMREKASQPDVFVSNEGSIFLLTPMSDKAREWISEHIPEGAMYMGRALVVEHRYVEDIVAGMQGAGLIVK